MDDTVLRQLIEAVNIILNSSSTLIQRMQAHHICQQCRDSDQCGVIGFVLASDNTAEPQIKYFGLQLVQHYIQQYWIKVGQEIQLQMKNNALELFKKCPADEICYVKDGIAHVVVEIAKNVFPQQWTTMIQDLIELANSGPVQIELVELVFLRLAEDVAVLQNISVAHRIKDIRHGLSIGMSDVINFFLSALRENSLKYKSLCGTTNPSEVLEIEIYSGLTLNTLKVLQGFLEWISIEHIFVSDGAFIHLLCELINIEAFRVSAAECLLLIASRKGKPEERRHMLQLATPDYVKIMLMSIQSFTSHQEFSENQYLFLKRLGSVFGALVGHLISVISDRDNVTGPALNLSPYITFLDTLLAFLEHENRAISYTVAIPWNNLLRHKELRQDNTLHKYIPRIFEIAASRVRRDFRSLSASETQIDLCDDEERDFFLTTFRASMVEMVRWCARSFPIHCTNCALEWLSIALSSPMDTGTDDKGQRLETCTTKSPSYILWDSISTLLDVVQGCILVSLEEREEKHLLPSEQMEKSLESVLTLPLCDLLLCQCFLSCVSSFIPVLEYMPRKESMVVEVIQFIMRVLKVTRNVSGQSCNTVRRHSLAVLIRLCKRNSRVVALVNDTFKTLMLELVNNNSNILSPNEKISVFEAMILVSREWNDYHLQKNLVSEIMTISSGMWPKEDDACLLSSLDFAKAIGLCTPMAEFDSAENLIHSSIKVNMKYCSVLTLAVMSRSEAPEDLDVARQGGFLDENGIVRNPCAEDILSVAKHIVLFVNMLHGLWTKPVLDAADDKMVRSLMVRTCERRCLISGNPQQASEPDEHVEKLPWERLQSFIMVVFDCSYHILGNLGKCSPLIYENQDLLTFLLSKLFQDLMTLPKFKLKNFINRFLHPFLKHAPVGSKNEVAVPVLMKFCGFMNRDLQHCWDRYGSKEQARLKVIETSDEKEEQDEGKEEEEILEEQILRVLSREYLDMLLGLCLEKPRCNKKENPETESLQEDCMMQESSLMTVNSKQLTQLGIFLMGSDFAELLLGTPLVALSWYDTNTIFKAIQLISPILVHTFSTSQSIPDEVAVGLFQAVLRGIQRHGQHDGCLQQLLALALYIYTSLRSSHPSLREIMLSIPNMNMATFKNFDKNYEKMTEKSRKVGFKKLVVGIVEQHVGQRFKVEQKLQFLPKMIKLRKKEKPQDSEAPILSLGNLFMPEAE